MKPTLFALMLLSGCSYIPGTGAHKIAQAEKNVAYQLVDADSAKFRNERISGSYVCGEVNSKNSFNGYTGFTPFAVNESGKVQTIQLLADGSNETALAVVNFPTECLDEDDASYAANASERQAQANILEQAADNLEAMANEMAGNIQ